MTTMIIMGLLDLLDPLPYRERMRRLTHWARTAPDRAEVCAELRRGEPYERHLALVAALAVHDTAAIDEATRDPDPAVRQTALTAALRDGRLTGRVPELAAADRRRIYRTLRAFPRPELADPLILEIRSAFGDDEAAGLLSACGASTVRTLLPDLAHATNLARLARRHPGPVADYATAVLTAAPAESLGREWGRIAAGASNCPPKRPST